MTEPSWDVEADVVIVGSGAAGAICSDSYVSGLSLSGCVYSGGRAGRSVIQTDQEETAHAV